MGFLMKCLNHLVFVLFDPLLLLLQLQQFCLVNQNLVPLV